MDRIEDLFEKLNFPGAERLKKALKNRGIPFTKEQVDNLVRGETVKQLQRAPPPLKGKVAAAYQNVEWQADLIDWTTAPSGGGNHNPSPVQVNAGIRKALRKQILRNIY